MGWDAHLSGVKFFQCSVSRFQTKPRSGSFAIRLPCHGCTNAPQTRVSLISGDRGGKTETHGPPESDPVTWKWKRFGNTVLWPSNRLLLALPCTVTIDHGHHLPFAGFDDSFFGWVVRGAEARRSLTFCGEFPLSGCGGPWGPGGAGEGWDEALLEWCEVPPDFVFHAPGSSVPPVVGWAGRDSPDSLSEDCFQPCLLFHGHHCLQERRGDLGPAGAMSFVHADSLSGGGSAIALATSFCPPGGRSSCQQGWTGSRAQGCY